MKAGTSNLSLPLRDGSFSAPRLECTPCPETGKELTAGEISETEEVVEANRTCDDPNESKEFEGKGSLEDDGRCSCMGLRDSVIESIPSSNSMKPVYQMLCSAVATSQDVVQARTLLNLLRTLKCPDLSQVTSTAF